MKERQQSIRRLPRWCYLATLLLFGWILLFTGGNQFGFLGIYRTQDMGFPAVYWRKITVFEPFTDNAVPPAVRDNAFSGLALAVDLAILGFAMLIVILVQEALSQKQFSLRSLVVLTVLAPLMLGAIKLAPIVSLPPVDRFIDYDVIPGRSQLVD